MLKTNRAEYNISLSKSFYPSVSDNYGLIKTIWDQGSPYNRYAPLAKNKAGTAYERVPAGCVTIALAQILRYHSWPPIRITGNPENNDQYGHRKGTYTAGCIAGVNDCGDILLRDYDWANMRKQVFDSSTLDEKKAVAQLVWHCGVAVSMNYEHPNYGGSGSNSRFCLNNL